jgi:type VI protein secretion system component VasF
MLNTQRIRGMGADGAYRVAEAMSDIQSPWKVRRRKRAHRARRLLWIIGAVVGFLAMAGLVWGLSCREQSGRKEED